jgi:hypothetical protein
MRLVRVTGNATALVGALGLAGASRPTETRSIGGGIRTDCRVVRLFVLNARASFSSPGKPGLLCGTFDVRHVFSRGYCSACGPHGLSMA